MKINFVPVFVSKILNTFPCNCLLNFVVSIYKILSAKLIQKNCQSIFRSHFAFLFLYGKTTALERVESCKNNVSKQADRLLHHNISLYYYTGLDMTVILLFLMNMTFVVLTELLYWNVWCFLFWWKIDEFCCSSTKITHTSVWKYHDQIISFL